MAEKNTLVPTLGHRFINRHKLFLLVFLILGIILLSHQQEIFAEGSRNIFPAGSPTCGSASWRIVPRQHRMAYRYVWSRGTNY